MSSIIQLIKRLIEKVKAMFLINVDGVNRPVESIQINLSGTVAGTTPPTTTPTRPPTTTPPTTTPPTTTPPTTTPPTTTPPSTTPTNPGTTPQQGPAAIVDPADTPNPANPFGYSDWWFGRCTTQTVAEERQTNGAAPTAYNVTRESLNIPATDRIIEIRSNQDLDDLTNDLVAGDWVLVYPNAVEDYNRLICISGQGTRARPIRVVGISDGAGNRPKWNFENGRLSAMWGRPWALKPTFQGLGGIVIGVKNIDHYTVKPKNIHISGIEFRGTFNGALWYNLDGVSKAFSFAAPVRPDYCDGFRLRNCVITRCANGVFTQQKASVVNGLGEGACEKVEILNNWFKDCGTPGVDGHHDIYSQASGCIIDGNYLGLQYSGARGSSLKDRSGGTIVRNNIATNNARAFDLVDAEDQALTGDSTITRPDYQFVYLYNNTAVGITAYRSIHFGGDKQAEQAGGISIPPLILNDQCKKNLFAWNNTFTCSVPGGHWCFMQMSASNVNAWFKGNSWTFGSLYPGCYISLIEHAGQLHWGPNQINWLPEADSRYRRIYNAKGGTNPANYNIYIDQSNALTFATRTTAGNEAGDISIPTPFTWPENAMLVALKGTSA